jgi:hypothetical protein
VAVHVDKYGRTVSPAPTTATSSGTPSAAGKTEVTRPEEVDDRRRSERPSGRTEDADVGDGHRWFHPVARPRGEIVASSSSRAAAKRLPNTRKASVDAVHTKATLSQAGARVDASAVGGVWSPTTYGSKASVTPHDGLGRFLRRPDRAVPLEL